MESISLGAGKARASRCMQATMYKFQDGQWAVIYPTAL